MQKITEKFLKEGQSANGGWSKRQLNMIGVNWPPASGWKQTVIGQLIEEKTARDFLAAKQ